MSERDDEETNARSEDDPVPDGEDQDDDAGPDDVTRVGPEDVTRVGPDDVTRVGPDDPTRVSGRVPGHATSPSHPRYDFRDLLGVGGQGIVLRAHDRELEREVALKTLADTDGHEEDHEDFLTEARAAAGLEHPNILPIYDVGRLEDGRPYYTMRLIEGRTLGDVIASLDITVRDEPESWREADWNLVRLVQVAQQTCRALQHAHARDLLHRDVKPSNILLGPVGEALLVDWGIAASIRRFVDDTVISGTPPYMSPEQASGKVLDARTDIHALGVVLYEILTLQRPYTGRDTAALLRETIHATPLDPEMVARAWPVPPELSALVMRMLAKRRDERPGSAREVHDELQAFLEGVRDRERREAEAAACRHDGGEALQRHEQALTVKTEAEREVLALSDVHPPWQPVVEKRPLLEARARVSDADEQAQVAFLEAIHRYTDALAYMPDDEQASAALADVFWTRFAQAERVGDRDLARTYRMLVERFHCGRYERELRDVGALELKVVPEHARLTLHPLVERDLVLVDGPGDVLGTGSIELDEIPMGSHVIVAEAEGHEPARYPLWIERGETWKGELRLLPEGGIPDGFVYVPGTTAWLGGDPIATNGWDLRRVEVESFLMQRHPVTFAEYCEFLDGAGEHAAHEHVPRTETDGALCALVNGAHQPCMTEDVSRDVLRSLPVFAVDKADAEAFAAWKSAGSQREFRLPTAEEWELAARGVDRRIHPWGNRFDAALCHGRDAFEGTPQPRPVGSFSTDRSVHGVRDLAGCIQEWTASPFGRGDDVWEARGASWQNGPSVSRAAWRGGAADIQRNGTLGFRLAVRAAAPQLPYGSSE